MSCEYGGRVYRYQEEEKEDQKNMEDAFSYLDVMEKSITTKKDLNGKNGALFNTLFYLLKTLQAEGVNLDSDHLFYIQSSANPRELKKLTSNLDNIIQSLESFYEKELQEAAMKAQNINTISQQAGDTAKTIFNTNAQAYYSGNNPSDKIY
jgi:hypothetical protein